MALKIKKKLLVIIDVGHGGTDSGATGFGLKEKELNLNTALAMYKKLIANGYKAIILRDKDITQDLNYRTNKANQIAKDNPDYLCIFISVHHNAGGGDRGEYIYSICLGDSYEIANAIGEEMNSKVGQQKKMYSKKGTDNSDYYHIIRESNPAAMIWEVGFIDNKVDVQLFDTKEEQIRNGELGANAITSWAEKKGFVKENNAKPSTPTTPSKPKEPSKTTLKKGDKVMVKKSAKKYTTGKVISSFVLGSKYTISNIDKDKVLLSEIQSWLFAKDVQLVIPPKPQEEKEYYIRTKPFTEDKDYKVTDKELEKVQEILKSVGYYLRRLDKGMRLNSKFMKSKVALEVQKKLKAIGMFDKMIIKK